MARMHLFEWADLPWFPQLLRDAMTSYLRYAMQLTGQGAEVAKVLAGVVAELQVDEVLDLAAGGGGLSEQLLEAMQARGLEQRLVLADLWPNRPALSALAERHERIEAVLEPQDAAQVQRPGLRMMVNAFHHLEPDKARAVLEDAVRARQPVVILELLAREPVFLLGMLLTPIGVTLTAPFWKPFRATNLLFAWLIPILQPLVAFDGVVSCLRVYSEEELLELTAGLDDFRWTVTRPPLGQGGQPRGVMLLGRPKEA